LRVGLRYYKGLSERAISSIVSERRKRPFSSVAELYQRSHVERDSLENLIKGGFLDALANHKDDRLRLLDEIKDLPKKQARHQPEILLSHPASWWLARERRDTEYLSLTETQKERMEWEVLGLNVHRHPLSPYREAFRELGVTSSQDIKELPHGTRAHAAGLLECLQSPPTKSGRPVWFLLIEDEQGLLQATILRNVYERYGDLLHHRGAFLLEGRVQNTPKKGFSFLVKNIGDLGEVLVGARVPTPMTVSASGTFLRAGRPGRRAG
jgi:error-prone DNA polymerase